MGRKKGFKHSEETKKKIGSINKIKRLGKKHSEESKNKMSRNMKGVKKKPRTLEHSKNISNSLKNGKSRWYIDGRSKINKTERQLIMESPEYKLWRKSVFERDNYTCQFCNAYGVKLNADHIKSFRNFPELRLDINNGRTLCVKCHWKTETFGRRGL